MIDLEPPVGAGLAPLVVEVTRGDMIESCHRVHAVVSDRRGRVIVRWGDWNRTIFPRSAVKAIQALPFVESGAADAFGLGDAEIALACASHRGRPAHVQRVAAWLTRIGCTVADLACGAHAPKDQAAAKGLTARGAAPSVLHNNCSGKHTALLTTARHLGEPLAGYVAVTSPVQQRLLGTLETVTGQDLGGAPFASDGCSIPTYGVPLGGLAVGMATLADPVDLPDRRAEAILRIRQAWANAPEMIAAEGHLDTEIARHSGGRVLTKTGAEGVYGAILPEFGLGVALKVEDGTPRAARIAVAWILDRIGAFEGLPRATVDGWLSRPVRTVAGAAVGAIRVAEGTQDVG